LPDLFVRHPDNPILAPGRFAWRACVTFNPGVVFAHGRTWLYERAAGSLRPFCCALGLQVSDDGAHFEPYSAEPVFTPAMAGSAYGSVQDPRVVALDGRWLMTYAFRPFAWHSHPTGVGVPESFEPSAPGFSGRSEDNQTRSGLAVSDDLVHWRHLCWATEAAQDDRDVILFPERVAGRYALLRRPLHLVTPSGTVGEPAIRLSYSTDLEHWSPPAFVAGPKYAWEGGRIGGATPPIRTDAGWLAFHHGVETVNAATRRVIYRVGALLLDLDDPTRVLARTPEPLLEPQAYYERVGLYIPNVVFPTGVVLRDGTLWLYYGVCDTAIALATARLDDVLDHVLSCPA